MLTLGICSQAKYLDSLDMSLTVLRFLTSNVFVLLIDHMLDVVA